MNTQCKLGNNDIGYGNCFFHQPNGQCSVRKTHCEWDDRSTWDAAHEDELKQQVAERIYKTHMRCPRCGEPLTFCGMKSYVNLGEHVSCLENNPDWKPPLRPGFTCQDCFSESFYDADGDLFNCGVLRIPDRYLVALNSDAFKIWFDVNSDMQKTNPGYAENLKQEMLKLPDCPKKVESDAKEKL
jgi:hypothetical protein